MRRMRKQPVAAYNEWDFDREPGERVYARRYGIDEEGAVMHDLCESRGFHKSAAGELTPRTVKKNRKPRIAVLADDGFWYWND